MQPVQDLTVDDMVSRTEYQYTLEDPNQQELNQVAAQLVAKLKKLPQLADVVTDQQLGAAAEQVEIDRATASRFGVTTSTIDNTLYDAFGQRQVNTMYTQVNQYHVILEADPNFQKDPHKLNDIYVQATTTGTVPATASNTAGSSSGAGSGGRRCDHVAADAIVVERSFFGVVIDFGVVVGEHGFDAGDVECEFERGFVFGVDFGNDFVGAFDHEHKRRRHRRVRRRRRVELRDRLLRVARRAAVVGAGDRAARAAAARCRRRCR